MVEPHSIQRDLTGDRGCLTTIYFRCPYERCNLKVQPAPFHLFKISTLHLLSHILPHPPLHMKPCELSAMGSGQSSKTPWQFLRAGRTLETALAGQLFHIATEDPRSMTGLPDRSVMLEGGPCSMRDGSWSRGKGLRPINGMKGGRALFRT